MLLWSTYFCSDGEQGKQGCKFPFHTLQNHGLSFDIKSCRPLPLQKQLYFSIETMSISLSFKTQTAACKSQKWRFFYEHHCPSSKDTCLGKVMNCVKNSLCSCIGIFCVRTDLQYRVAIINQLNDLNLTRYLTKLNYISICIYTHN